MGSVEEERNIYEEGRIDRHAKMKRRREKEKRDGEKRGRKREGCE